MVLIDKRKGSVEMASRMGIPNTVTHLEYADAAFQGVGPGDAPVLVGVERKHIADMVSSMDSGRLSGHQLIGLVNSYNYVYLIVEGYWRARADGLLEVKKREWTPMEFGSRRYLAKEVTRFMNTLEVLCGVFIWRTNTLRQTVDYIEDLYGWWQKPWEQHTSHLQFHRPDVERGESLWFSKPALTTRMVKEISGVGWHLAKAVSARFPTMEMLMGATERELRSVEGVGKVLAKEIYEGLRRVEA